MVYSLALSLLPILNTVVNANPLPEVSTNLPFNIDYFTNTVASVQNTYCGAEHNNAGLQFGDQTLVKSVTFGGDEQRVNIYTSDSLGVIVAYQGTNLTNIDSIIHDAELLKVPPAPALGISWDSFVFAGWQDQFNKTWDEVKTTLNSTLQSKPGAKVQVIGHSQGAAIAQLGALAIYHAFGDVIDKVICYGPPRVGNAIYARDFDAAFKGKYVGVTNGQDWVYSVPPTFLGFQHPSGMVWINPANSTSWTYYPDSEDPRGPDASIPEYVSSESVKSYPFLFFGDHQGIYMHSKLGTSKGGPCPAQVGGY